MAVTKAAMVEHLFTSMGFTKSGAKTFVEDFFDVIRKALETGHVVKLSGFGNFYLRDKNARPGRNPKRGLVVMIDARRVVTFHAGQKLKARIEQHVRPEEENKES